MNNEKQKQTNRTTLFFPLADESGAVLLITMIILLLLTLIGVSGINTASTDIQITRNYRIHNLNLVCADAAVNRAKSLIVYNQATLADPWVNNISNLYLADKKYFKLENDGDTNTNWDTVSTPVLNEIDVDKVILDWDNAKNANIPNIAAITPTSMPSDTDIEYVVYKNPNSAEDNCVVIARSRKNGGDVIIEAGFNQE